MASVDLQALYKEAWDLLDKDKEYPDGSNRKRAYEMLKEHYSSVSLVLRKHFFGLWPGKQIVFSEYAKLRVSLATFSSYLSVHAELHDIGQESAQGAVQ